MVALSYRAQQSSAPVRMHTHTHTHVQGRTYPLGKVRRLPWAPKSQGPHKCFLYSRSADTQAFITRQQSTCPSWMCFLCILLVANENIMHLKLMAAWARILSFPARVHLFTLAAERAALSVKTQIYCFSNLTRKYSRNHRSAIVFILCVTYLILSDDGMIINQDFCAD